MHPPPPASHPKSASTPLSHPLRQSTPQKPLPPQRRRRGVRQVPHLTKSMVAFCLPTVVDEHFLPAWPEKGRGPDGNPNYRDTVKLVISLLSLLSICSLAEVVRHFFFGFFESRNSCQDAASRKSRDFLPRMRLTEDGNFRSCNVPAYNCNNLQSATKPRNPALISSKSYFSPTRGRSSWE